MNDPGTCVDIRTAARGITVSSWGVRLGLAILVVAIAVVGPAILPDHPGWSVISARDGAILSGAVVGVSGSYYLYWRRRRDARDRLRAAIFAELALVGDEIYEEIRDMTVTELGTELYVPDESPIVVTVYENNAGEIGRLSEREIEELTSFYTFASIVEPRMERMTAESDVTEIEVVLLRRRLIELFNRKNSALEALAGELDDTPVDVEHEGDIERGDVVEEVADSLDIDLDLDDAR